ncbi:hypothetical protein IJJ08_01740 [bacterium]|nr:hypothetical protein [bacterium]
MKERNVNTNTKSTRTRKIGKFRGFPPIIIPESELRRIENDPNKVTATKLVEEWKKDPNWNKIKVEW